MDLIKSLNESKLFTSANAFHRLTGRQLAELAYLHLIGLRIMTCEKVTREHAKAYALKTNNHDKFKKWRQSSTDVYLILYSLLADDVKMHDDTSKHFVDTLNIDVAKITAWLLSASSAINPMTETRAHRLFAQMDNMFKVNDSTLRSIRRLAMNWPDLTKREKQLCFTRLIQIMRQRCPQSDLFTWLEKLSKNNGLELMDVCDIETGHGCGPEDQPRDTTLSQAAQQHRSVYEDDGGAAPAAGTTSADIAPVVKVLGKVRRRNPK